MSYSTNKSNYHPFWESFSRYHVCPCGNKLKKYIIICHNIWWFQNLTAESTNKTVKYKTQFLLCPSVLDRPMLLKTCSWEKAKKTFLHTTKIQLAFLLFHEGRDAPSMCTLWNKKSFYWHVITHIGSKWNWIIFKFVTRTIHYEKEEKKQFDWYVYYILTIFVARSHFSSFSRQTDGGPSWNLYVTVLNVQMHKSLTIPKMGTCCWCQHILGFLVPSKFIWNCINIQENFLEAWKLLKLLCDFE